MSRVKTAIIAVMISASLLCGCTQQSKETGALNNKTSKTEALKETVASNKKASKKESSKKTQSSAKKDSYKIFTQDYNNIYKNFKMKNFKEIGEGELQHSCTAFVKLKNFSEKRDFIGNDIQKSVKRNLYYYNSDEKILIYITHIYMKESMNKHLLTADYPYETIDSKEKLKMPVYSETYMCYRHTLVNLKVYSFDNNTSKLTKTGIKALKEYDSILK